MAYIYDLDATFADVARKYKCRAQVVAHKATEDGWAKEKQDFQDGIEAEARRTVTRKLVTLAEECAIEALTQMRSARRKILTEFQAGLDPKSDLTKTSEEVSSEMSVGKSNVTARKTTLFRKPSPDSVFAEALLRNEVELIKAILQPREASTVNIASQTALVRFT